jgi:hypothetical protein
MAMAIETATETYLLRNDNTLLDLSSLAASIFGHLVRLAAPIVTAYHGDLFYDATFVDHLVVGVARAEFYWQPREFGTAIGQTDEYMSGRRYRFVAELVDGKATLTIITVGDLAEGATQ